MKKFTLIHLFFTFISLATCLAQPCLNGRYASDVFTNFTTISNINFGQNNSFTGANTPLALDFYSPTGDTETSRPLIIWVHGGSFLGGTKTDIDVLNLSQRFALKGYACASINYRTGFFPIDSANAVKAVVRAVQDLKAAIRFFYKDQATGTNLYKIDTNQIFIGGSSAGAITALHVAYLNDPCEISGYLSPTTIQTLGGLEGTSGNPGYSTNVKGVINLCGALARYGWLEAGDVPLCSIHGTSDGTVKYNRGVVNPGTPLMYLDGSRMLHDRACAINVQSNFYTFPGAPHVPYAGTSASALAYMDTTENFVRDFLVDRLGCTETPLQLANAPLQLAILYPMNYCDGSPIDEVCLGAGIEETTELETLIYPNPTSGNITINLSVYNQYQIQIVDMSGRTLEERSFEGVTQSIDLSGYKNGTYLILIRNLNQETITKRIIKQ